QSEKYFFVVDNGLASILQSDRCNNIKLLPSYNKKIYPTMIFLFVLSEYLGLPFNIDSQSHHDKKLYKFIISDIKSNTKFIFFRTDFRLVKANIKKIISNNKFNICSNIYENYFL